MAHTLSGKKTMKEKTIMERWAQAKRSFNREYIRLCACLLEAEGIVNNKCGQSILFTASQHWGLELKWGEILKGADRPYQLRVNAGGSKTVRGRHGEEYLHNRVVSLLDNASGLDETTHWVGGVTCLENHVTALSAINTGSIIAQWEAYASKE
jgi:hypothetical protein